MIFRQLFDSTSGTYTYLLASRHGGEALIIDPVLERVDRYLQLVRELDLKLVKAVDTHLHADHVTGLGALRDRTQCVTVMGVHGLDQPEVEFAHQLQLAVDAIENRIDDQRLAAMTAGEQIGVGAGGAVEQLAEDHVRLVLVRVHYDDADALRLNLPSMRGVKTPRRQGNS